MFVLQLQHSLTQYHHSLTQTLAGNRLVLALAAALCIALFTWRVWRFCILPALHPERPRELPYWVPGLGHTISFVRNAQSTLDHARRWFGNSQELYALTLGGETLYVITSPDDIAAVHKNNASLVFDGFIKDVMITMGARPITVEKLYHKPDKHRMTVFEPDQNPTAKHFIGLTHDRYLTQLSPGQHLESLKDGFLHYLDIEVRLERLPREFFLSESPETQKVSLLHLCRDIVIKCNTNILFGERLLEIDPGLPKTFCTFDDDHWMMLYKMPRLLARHVHSSQQKIKDDFMRYLDIPTFERPGEAWLIRTMEDGMRALGISEEEMATQFLLVYWSANANGYKLAFWMLAFILKSPSLHQIILTEIAPAFWSTTVPASDHIFNHTPQLEAIFLEVLRLMDAPGTARTVISDTVIGEKKLRAGAKLLIPYRQLHLDPKVFGITVASFDPDRFQRDKTLARSPSYRPFGGGVTLCPGRFLARSEVLMFVAMVLWRFDLKVAEDDEKMKGSGFPKPEDRNPPIGVLGPIRGQDVLIEIRAAKR